MDFFQPHNKDLLLLVIAYLPFNDLNKLMRCSKYMNNVCWERKDFSEMSLFLKNNHQEVDQIRNDIHYDFLNMSKEKKPFECQYLKLFIQRKFLLWYREPLRFRRKELKNLVCKFIKIKELSEENKKILINMNSIL